MATNCEVVEVVEMITVTTNFIKLSEVKNMRDDYFYLIDTPNSVPLPVCKDVRFGDNDIIDLDSPSSLQMPTISIAKTQTTQVKPQVSLPPMQQNSMLRAKLSLPMSQPTVPLPYPISQPALGMPQVTLAMPQVTLAMPQVTLAMPQVPPSMPQVQLSMPQVPPSMPQVPFSMPQVSHTMPTTFPIAMSQPPPLAPVQTASSALPKPANIDLLYKPLQLHTPTIYQSGTGTPMVAPPATMRLLVSNNRGNTVPSRRSSPPVQKVCVGTQCHIMAENPRRNRAVQTDKKGYCSVAIQCTMFDDYGVSDVEIEDDPIPIEDSEKLSFNVFANSKTYPYENGMLECLLCGEVCGNQREMNYHMALHYGPSMLCSKCGINFEHRVLYTMHKCKIPGSRKGLKIVLNSRARRYYPRVICQHANCPAIKLPLKCGSMKRRKLVTICGHSLCNKIKQKRWLKRQTIRLQKRIKFTRKTTSTA